MKDKVSKINDNKENNNKRNILFWTIEGIPVPSVTAAQMREVDRIATKVFNLSILQMMENAGRSLCENVIEILKKEKGEITIIAGAGGNGGGGLCGARHLHNHGFHVNIILDHDKEQLIKVAANQLKILQTSGLNIISPSKEKNAIYRADIVIDALIGYSLHGAPSGKTKVLIELCNEYAKKVISLDLPSGLNATTGESLGSTICSDRIMTLALPKTGLISTEAEILVADIGIPIELYKMMGIDILPLFKSKYYQSLLRRKSEK